MTERDFIYWLNGFLELSKVESLNKEQLDEIKKHISLVITKVDIPAPTIPGGIDFFSPTTRIC